MDANSTTKYGRIKHDLLEKICSGAYGAGDSVPGELELAAQYGVSRASTRMALRDLAMAGYLVRAKGRGSHVTDKASRGVAAPSSAQRPLAFVLPGTLCPTACSVFQSFAEAAAGAGFNAVGLPKSMLESLDVNEYAAVRARFAGAVVWESGLQLQPPITAATVRVTACAPATLGESEDAVALPHAGAIEALTNEVLRTGHRRVGLITVTGAMGDACEAACQLALRRAGAVQCMVVRFDPMCVADPCSLVARLLAQPRRPSALVSAHEDFTRRLIRGLRRLGYNGVDDVVLASMERAMPRDERWPRIRALFSPEAVASRCLELISRRLERPGDPPHVAQLRVPLDEIPATVFNLSDARGRASMARAAGQY